MQGDEQVVVEAQQIIALSVAIFNTINLPRIQEWLETLREAMHLPH